MPNTFVVTDARGNTFTAELGDDQLVAYCDHALPDGSRFEIRRVRKDRNWKAGAVLEAEAVCQEQLVRIYGSLEAGMKDIGYRSFVKWMNRVEAAIESENPEEDPE